MDSRERIREVRELIEKAESLSTVEDRRQAAVEAMATVLDFASTMGHADVNTVQRMANIVLGR